MLSILNDSQRAVVDTMTMRLTTKQSLDYLKDHGLEMSESKFFRIKRKVDKMKLKRLYHIAKIGFEEQHLERIHQLELIQRLMWEAHKEEQSPFRKAAILEKIANIQPYLSSYYDATNKVMRNSASANKQENNNIPDN